MKNKKLLGVGLLVILIAVFAIAYGAFHEKPVEGTKEITIEVVDKEQGSTVYELKTDAEYLRQAMEEAEEAADMAKYIPSYSPTNSSTDSQSNSQTT